MAVEELELHEELSTARIVEKLVAAVRRRAPGAELVAAGEGIEIPGAGVLRVDGVAEEARAEIARLARHAAVALDNARAAELAAGEKRLLEMVATGEPLPAILDAVCRLVERLASRSLASIVLLDAGGGVHHGAAPSLPARPCWSTPILARDGVVLGTFALYDREPAEPTAFEMELVRQLTHLASIAIARDRAERALRLSEAYLHQAQRLAGTGSYSWAPATGEVRWSAETYRIYGVDPDRAPDLSLVLQRTHPDDVEAYRAVLERSAREGVGFEHERRLVLPDGTVRIISVVAQPVARESPDGGVVIVGAVRDVTATRREAERLRSSLEEKDALLKEVHHRVKNNLQLISSLLSLQASRTGDRAVAELFADSRNRVRSMALVHEDLYRAGNFARIAMANHVRTLCAHLGRAYGAGEAERVRIEVQVDPLDLELGLDEAVSVGLIVNELVSNALKHAFPAGRTGRVVVELSGPREEEGDRHRLCVRDDGVGLPAGFAIDDRGRMGAVESMGLQLVTDLTEQLGGSVVVERGAGGGTGFVIRF